MIERGGKMLNDNISLTPQDILEKEFKIDTSGYRRQEVDKYLDIIIKDYAQFNSMIKKLDAEKKELVEENLELKRELRNLHANMEVIKNSDKEVTNLDIIRRLSQLEKMVYDKDEE
jgi:DivIVA domain-containing protein